jgi:beta-lactam-binding protein with PASTA domain/tRNA A-37 threonylcarbamoyl transferase component Bud32
LAEIGSVLGGRYRLVELLGQGGMATIFRATDSQLGRDVAVKVLRPEYGRDPDFVARFRMEAQSVASLSSPNIVVVHDFGMDPAGPFIVMDYVDGEDLATLLRRTGPLSPSRAARIAAEVGRALAVAHSRGIIHRDIKPGNILLAHDGRVQVTDFGIARAIAEAQMTLPGTTLGSVQYMSPEQARGEPATERSDLYSLGVVLFEMLAGRRPFEGDSAASIAMARLTPPVPMPSTYRAGIPPVLEAICRKAMAIDPMDRFSSANAMADALEDDLADRTAGVAGLGVAAAGTAVVAGVARANPGSPIPYAPDAYAGAGSAAPPPPRPPAPPPLADDRNADGGGAGPWAWIAGLLGLAILALVGFLAFKLLTGGSTPTADQVVVPNFVGQTLDQAQPLADAKGLIIKATQFVKSNDQPEGTITAQDPGADATVAKGATVNVTVVTGQALVAVPDVKSQTESTALKTLVQAGLTPGTSTQDFDPVVIAGSVVSTSPAAGVEVASGTTIDYVVSKGPEPTPSPSPTPVPTPTPSPTPPSTPSPTPTASLSTVGEYRCQTLSQATADIEADGFTVGTVTPEPPGYTAADDSLVFEQLPVPGKKRAAGTPIALSVYDPASYPYPTCPPTAP